MNSVLYNNSIFDLAWNIIQSSAILLLFFWIFINLLAFGTMYYFYKKNKMIKYKFFSKFLDTSIITFSAAELFDALKISIIISSRDSDDIDNSLTWLESMWYKVNFAQCIDLCICKLKEIFNSKIYFKHKLA